MDKYKDQENDEDKGEFKGGDRLIAMQPTKNRKERRKEMKRERKKQLKEQIKRQQRAEKEAILNA